MVMEQTEKRMALTINQRLQDNIGDSRWCNSWINADRCDGRRKTRTYGKNSNIKKLTRAEIIRRCREIWQQKEGKNWIDKF